MGAKSIVLAPSHFKPSSLQANSISSQQHTRISTSQQVIMETQSSLQLQHTCLQCSWSSEQCNHWWQVAQYTQSLYESSRYENSQLEGLVAFWNNHVCPQASEPHQQQPQQQYSLVESKDQQSQTQFQIPARPTITCDAESQSESVQTTDSSTQSDLSVDEVNELQKKIEQQQHELRQIRKKQIRKEVIEVRSQQQQCKSVQKAVQAEREKFTHRLETERQTLTQKFEAEIEAQQDKYSKSNAEMHSKLVISNKECMKLNSDVESAHQSLEFVRVELQTQNLINIQILNERDRILHSCQTLSKHAASHMDKIDTKKKQIAHLHNTIGTLVLEIKNSRHQTNLAKAKLIESEETLAELLNALHTETSPSSNSNSKQSKQSKQQQFLQYINL